MTTTSPKPSTPAEPIYTVTVQFQIGEYRGEWTGREIKLEPQCKIVCESPSRGYAGLVFKRLAGLAYAAAPSEQGEQDGPISNAHNAGPATGDKSRADILDAHTDSEKRPVEVTGAALEPESAEAFYQNNHDDPRWTTGLYWSDNQVFALAEAYAAKLRATVEELRAANKNLESALDLRKYQLEELRRKNQELRKGLDASK